MSRESNTKSHIGKTKRDHVSGAHHRRGVNQQVRADWQNSHKREEGLKDFPFATCNGQRGRKWKKWLNML